MIFRLKIDLIGSIIHNRHMNTLSRSLKQGQTIGILGGGQLARMLCESAHRMGFKTLVFCSSHEEPAAQVSPFTEDSAFFAQQTDVITFESEFFDSENLKAKFAQNRFAPNLTCLESIQYRNKQKNWLCNLKIPTSDFIEVSSAEELQQFFSKHQKIVVKKNFGGYDGFGTFVIKNETQLKSFLKEDGRSINEKTNLMSVPSFDSSKRMTNSLPEFIAEAFIPFKKEVAISVCRDQYKKKLFLPLVETKQKNNKCDLVVGPLKHSKITSLQKSLAKLVDELDYVGILAFELFDTGDQLIVNELAPRVHNSAHYSQLALNHSQFDLHIMTVAGLRLPTSLEIQSKAFAMSNLVGTRKEPIQIQEPYPSHLYLYGKPENRPGRKMGHINALGKNHQEALKKVILSRKKVQL